MRVIGFDSVRLAPGVSLAARERVDAALISPLCCVACRGAAQDICARVRRLSADDTGRRGEAVDGLGMCSEEESKERDKEMEDPEVEREQR